MSRTRFRSRLVYRKSRRSWRQNKALADGARSVLAARGVDLEQVRPLDRTGRIHVAYVRGGHVGGYVRSH